MSHSEKFAYWTPPLVWWTRPSNPSYSPFTSLKVDGSSRQW